MTRQRAVLGEPANAVHERASHERCVRREEPAAEQRLEPPVGVVETFAMTDEDVQPAEFLALTLYVLLSSPEKTFEDW